jgi:iduronate 2-sulfatase
MITPNLEKLSQTSLFLHKNYVQQAVCSPTRTSLLTSRRPDATRVWDLYSYFRDVAGNYTTIPQYFRQQGYDTYGMGKIFHPVRAAPDAET